MTIEFTAHQRKPFVVGAVQATPLNLKELAEVTGGELRHDGEKEGQLTRDFIKIQVRNPKNNRQTEIHVGDYVVKQGNTFKSYPEKSFHQQFEVRQGGDVTPKVRQRNDKPAKKGPTPGNMPRKKTKGAIAQEYREKNKERRAAHETENLKPEQGVTPDPQETTKLQSSIEAENGERVIQETFGETAEMTKERREREVAAELYDGDSVKTVADLEQEAGQTPITLDELEARS